jgi:hypothetical protein
LWCRILDAWNRPLRGVRWYFRHVLPRIGQLLARNRQSAYNYLPASVSEFPMGDELAGLMRECGLGPVAWKPLTFGVAALYVGRKPGEIREHGVREQNGTAAASLSATVKSASSCAISS